MNNVKVKTMSILMAILTMLSCIPSIGHAITYGDAVALKKGAWMQGMYCDFVGYKTEITKGKYEQYLALQTGDGKPAYCAQLGTDFHATNSGKLQATSSNFSDRQEKYITAALIYGYQGSSKYGKSTTIEYCATQAIVWSIQLDSFNKDDENFLKHAFVTSGGHLNNCSVANAKAAKEVYYKIKEQILSHYTIPSFSTRDVDASAGKNITLKWNGSKYTASVKDKNGILSHYNFKLNGVTFAKSGNTLTISTTKTLNKASVSGERVSNKYVSNLPAISAGYVSQTNQQTCIGIDLKDPVHAYFSLTTENMGNCKIIKTSEDGVKKGFSFRVTGNGIDRTIKTENDGTATLSNIPAGKYTVTEINVPDKYKAPTAKTVTVSPSTTASVSFYNTLKRGNLELIKSSEDGVVAGISFNIKGNGINTTVKTSSTGKIKVDNLLPGTYKVTEVDVDNKYIEPTAQSVTVTYDSTTTVTFRNVLKRGDIKIIKASEDGIIEGHEFRIQGKDVDKTVKTDTEGKIDVKGLLPGEYTISETNVNPRYEIPQSQTVTVAYNTVREVTFHNILKKGNVELIKESEDGEVSGKKFRITAEGYDEIFETNNEGRILVENLIITRPYTITEVETPSKYIQPHSRTITLQENETTTVNFENVLKKFTVSVQKSDAEYDNAQGDGSLEGAIYGVYKDGILQDTYLTDSKGSFTTSEYICGDNWTLKELSPSEGYLLDTTVYHIGSEAGNFKVERNTLSMSVKEQAIKGQIGLIKYKYNDINETREPEEDAEFQIWLKSAGSFDSADKTERDIILTDSEGVGKSKKLPYGTYVVRQSKGSTGYYLIEDFEVVISENNIVYHYSLDNKIMTSQITIIKKDIETEKQISLEGFGFKIRNTITGGFITMNSKCPSNVKISTFYTDSTGKLTLPQGLPFGNYELVEVETAGEYVLDNTPIPFTVKDDKPITLIKENISQKGKIFITKTGEVFSSVLEEENKYIPIYNLTGLQGAVFEIYAAEDIFTGDGTLKYSNNELVETVTTNSNGVAISKELYLGRYYVKETKTVHGSIIDNSIHPIELRYAGQEIEITANNLVIYNERQKVEINLRKVIEKDDSFKLGTNGEILNVRFGLFASEDIKAANGDIIPKNGMVDEVNVGIFGDATFRADVPIGKYYIKEIATDAHYVVSSKTYDVEFAYVGDDIPIIIITANNGEPIENMLIRGKIIGNKVDEDGKVVQGAVFGLFRHYETEFTENNTLMTSASDENGQFIFDNIPYGEWTICELKSAEGFVANKVPIKIVISADKQTVLITVKNRHVTGMIQTTKVDAEYPDNKLSKAEFTVYQDVNGNKKFDAEIDKKVDVLHEVEKGVYQLNGLRYGGYFLEETKNPEGFLRDINHYYFEIINDGEVVIIENKAGESFINNSIKGDVLLRKIDPEMGNLISGAEFSIYKDVDQNGIFDEITDTLVGVMKETQKGIYIYKELRYGTYFLKETKAPEGYLLDEGIYLFSIEEHGEIIEIENKADVGFTNLSIKGNVQLNKVDAETKELLSGAEFSLYKDLNQNGIYDKDIDIKIGMMEETEQGIYIYEDLRYGYYLVKEDKSPKGYVLDENYYPFVIQNNRENVIIENEAGKGFTNRPIKGALEITKTDITTGKVLPNAGFRIKDEAGNIVAEGRTDENGIAKFTLRYGKYTYQEFDAPDGYQIDTKEYPFEILEDGQIVKADMKNEPIPAPKTGANDETGANVAIILGSLAVIGGVIFFIIKRRKDSK